VSRDLPREMAIWYLKLAIFELSRIFDYEVTPWKSLCGSRNKWREAFDESGDWNPQLIETLKIS
jgi:hypothetical protein